jgi:23S rRNA (cytosine1962-C5)-methyltransferase
VILDPPHHGRGPKGETWQFETDFAALIEVCRSLLAERSFLILSTYDIGFSPIAFENVLGDFDGGSFECGELALPEDRPEEDLPARFLPAGLCARWWRGLPP